MFPVLWKKIVVPVFLSALFIALFFGMLPAARANELRVEPKVDERVELTSIVFHLAGTIDYNMSALTV